MMGEALTLSYKQTEALVRGMHDIDGRREAALFARFKYLQRMDFPARPSVGRGSRVGYRFEDVLQLALAFQLMEVGLSPLRIVRTLRTDWPTIRGVMVRAHRFVMALDAGEDELPEELLVITPAALLELGVDEDAGEPVRDALERDYRPSFYDWLEPDDWSDPDGAGAGVPSTGRIPDEVRVCCKVVVDPVRLVRLMVGVLDARLGVPAHSVRDAFEALEGPVPPR